MILKDFLYFLTDSAGNFYRVRAGVVELTTTPSPLPVTPDGWQEKSIKYGRSARYFGLIRSFSLPLKFIKDGATIVRNILYTQGTEAELFLVIHRIDKSFGGGWKHKFFYRGELDLTKVEDNETFVAVPVLEGDLFKSFKANENTTYELPLNVAAARIVKMDGLALQAKTTFTLTKSLAAQSLGRKQIIPMVFVGSQGNYFNLTFINDYGDLINGANNELTTEDLTTSGRWLFKTNNKGVIANIRVSGEIVGSGGNAGNNWYAETSLGQLVLLGTIAVSGPLATPTPFDFNADITLQPGEAVFVYRSSTPFNTNGFWNYTGETKIEVTTKDKADPTYIKALPLSYVFQQIIKKMTDSELYEFESDLLATQWDGLLVSSIDGVRGIDTASVKVSFSKLYDALNVAANISLTIAGATLSIERKSEAFGPAIVAELGEVTGLIAKPATDHLYNTVKIGWPAPQVEDMTVRDEFNVTQVYTSPVKKSVKELTLVADVIASMYEIELSRVQKKITSTTATNQDNRPCFIHCETTIATPSGDEPTIYNFYRLYRRAYDSITGLFDPASAFNVELSPKRCLIRHGDYLRSVFYWVSAGSLKYQTGERNSELKTVAGSEVIEEKADLTLASLPAPLFIPIQFTGTGRIPENLIDAMEDSPNQSISFEWNGDTWFAFVTDIGIQPADNAAQEFTALARPDNDLTKLID